MMDARDLEDHVTAIGNFRSHLQAMAARLIDSHAHGAAGLLLVLDQQVYNLHNRFMMGVQPAPAAESEPAKRAKGKRAPKGQGAHRHKFDPSGRCDCGANRRRAPKGSAQPDAEARTIPMPIVHARAPLGEHAPDKFDGGTFGSSGTTDRR